MISQLSRALALTASVFLAACGGADNDALFPAQSGSDAAVDGRAVKGVLAGATVTAEQYVEGEFRWVAETETDSSGLYSFDGLPAGVLRITVGAALDGSTRMLCDAPGGCGTHVDAGDDPNFNNLVDPGEWGPVPADFEMQTLAVVSAGSQNTLAVTPLTHLAALWAQAFPGDITDDVVNLAFDRIAGIFLLQEGFENTLPAAITDPDLTAEELQQALLLALFAEADGGTAGASLAGYADSFVAHGGQLPVTGEEYALSSLLADFPLLASLLDETDLAAAQDFLGTLLDTWAEASITGAGGSVEVDDTVLAESVAVLDELDHYLGLAGIDESGTFFSVHGEQIQFLLNEDMLNFAGVTIQSAGLVVATAVAGNQLIFLDQDFDGLVDVGSLMGDGSLSAIYNYAASPQTLTISGVSMGQSVNVEVELEPVGSDTVLDYAVEGSMVNSTAVGQLSGTLSVNVYDTDIQALLTAETLDDLMAVIQDMHVRAEIAGSGSLTGLGDEGEFSGHLQAWGELNVPAFGATPGTFLQAELVSGELCSPDGDCLYTLDGEPGLAVTMDQSAAASFAFGFEAFGMPAMELAGGGELPGASGLAQDLLLELSGAEGADASLFTALFGLFGEALVNTGGQARLTVPADDKAWEFTLESGRVDVSATNDTEVVISVLMTSVAGGYLINDGQLVGTFSVDWANPALTIALADGSLRVYRLGPYSDLLPQALLDALAGLFGGTP